MHEEDAIQSLALVIKKINALHEEMSKSENWDGVTKLYNDIYNCVNEDQLELFSFLIRDSMDSEFRSPK